jgi:hypothetical protein
MNQITKGWRYFPMPTFVATVPKEEQLGWPMAISHLSPVWLPLDSLLRACEAQVCTSHKSA